MGHQQRIVHRPTQTLQLIPEHNPATSLISSSHERQAKDQHPPTTTNRVENRRVRTRESFGVPVEAGDLDAETVQVQPACGKGAHDALDVGAALAPAHRADPDERLGGQVDPGPLVEVGAAFVVRQSPTLQRRHPKELRREFPQADEVAHGPPLMLADRQAGAFQDALFAHPVLRRRPGEVADLVGVAPDRPDVILLGDQPAPVKLQLGEAAGVERPFRDGARQGAAVTEAPVRHQQRDVRHASQPDGLMDAEVELHAGTALRRARTPASSATARAVVAVFPTSWPVR